jgi:hypothetical protein
MKTLLFLSAFLIVAGTSAFSQDKDTVLVTKKPKANDQPREMKTLLGKHEPGGGYGAFSVGYSLVDDRSAIQFGGRFEWIASHSIGFGFGGTGFMNEFHFEPMLNSDVAMAGGYGGLYIEPILMPGYPVHLSFPVLFGAGGVSYVSKNYDNYNNWIDQTEAFLIAEPGAELELSVTRHFRFSMGVTYRFTTPFSSNELNKINSKSIEGFSYMATFKFGRF